MEILKGLYRSKKLNIRANNYGGNAYNICSYTYLYFSEKKISIFRSNPPRYVSENDANNLNHFDDSATLEDLPNILANARNIELDEVDKSILKMSSELKKPDNQGRLSTDKQIFHGIIHEGGKAIKLKAWYQSSPDEVWLEDTFKYVETEEGQV